MRAKSYTDGHRLHMNGLICWVCFWDSLLNMSVGYAQRAITVLHILTVKSPSDALNVWNVGTAYLSLFLLYNSRWNCNLLGEVLQREGV